MSYNGDTDEYLSLQIFEKCFIENRMMKKNHARRPVDVSMSKFSR